MSDYNAEGAWQLVGLSTPDEQPDEVRSTIKTFGAAQHEAQLERSSAKQWSALCRATIVLV